MSAERSHSSGIDRVAEASSSDSLTPAVLQEIRTAFVRHQSMVDQAGGAFYDWAKETASDMMRHNGADNISHVFSHSGETAGFPRAPRDPQQEREDDIIAALDMQFERREEPLPPAFEAEQRIRDALAAQAISDEVVIIFD